MSVFFLLKKNKLEIFLEVKMPITNFSILLTYRDSLAVLSFETNNLEFGMEMGSSIVPRQYSPRHYTILNGFCLVKRIEDFGSIGSHKWVNLSVSKIN